MQFFLLDFALAFVVLLGYRALASVMRDRGPAMSPQSMPHPRAVRDPEVTRLRRRREAKPVLPERPLDDARSCRQGAGDTMNCSERPPHRLINLW